jgi:hypothetical protein
MISEPGSNQRPQIRSRGILCTNTYEMHKSELPSVCSGCASGDYTFWPYRCPEEMPVCRDSFKSNRRASISILSCTLPNEASTIQYHTPISENVQGPRLWKKQGRASFHVVELFPTRWARIHPPESVRRLGNLRWAMSPLFVVASYCRHDQS